MCNGAFDIAVLLEPSTRTGVQRLDELWLAANELGLQRFSEQVVQTEPLCFPVESYDEHVRLGQLTQLCFCAGQARHGVAERAGELLQYRRASEEDLVVFRQADKEF